MKKIIAPLTLLIALAACNESQQQAAKNAAKETKEVAGNLVNNVASGGVPGIYQGVLPCADCTGIETRLYVYDDSTYIEHNVYLGKPINSEAFADHGKWENHDGLVTFTSGKTTRKYKLGLNKLIQLDTEGKEIQSAHKLMYILSKVGDF